MEISKISYYCNSYKFFLQMIVYLVGQGYYCYHVGTIKENKKNKRINIDKKIIEKYNIDLSKHQRYRRKNKKLANFYYLRYMNIFIIFHTEGDIEMLIDDEFKDIRGKKEKLNRLGFKISDLVGFEISLRVVTENKRAATVILDKETIHGIKEELQDIAKTRNKHKLINSFKRLNGFPAWGGIIEQKQAIAKYILKLARQNQIMISEEDLYINTKRTPIANSDHVDEWAIGWGIT